MTVVTEGDLRRAVENDELLLLYHPQVELRSGRVVGAEACLRWRHPREGLLHAMRFVTAVPEAGLARDYMRWIVRTAAGQMARWRAESVSVGRVSINTWPESLGPDLIDDALAAVADAGIEPAAIEIETPPEATYDAATLGAVRAFRTAGFRVALDDVGDGDLRFVWFREAMFDVLKVPTTFVIGAPGAFDDAVIRSTVGFARAMGASVVAEGVETVAARDRVRDLGCDIGQGYLWSKIVPGAQMAVAIDAITIDGTRST